MLKLCYNKVAWRYMIIFSLLISSWNARSWWQQNITCHDTRWWQYWTD